MTLEEAIQTLGPDAIKTAAAEALRRVHPDTAGDKADPGAVARVLAAKTCLLSFLENAPSTHLSTCTACNGMGQLRTNFGSRPCTACNGKGVR